MEYVWVVVVCCYLFMCESEFVFKYRLSII